MAGISLIAGRLDWRHAVLLLLPVAALAALFSQGPIPQPSSYHLFADRRSCLGIPNAGDVASNLAFLISGGLGLLVCLRQRPAGSHISWTVFFAGVILVSIGSPYYHWNPNNETLVWDRLPMTIGFMGVYAAMLGEYVDKRLPRAVLVPAVLIGFASVFYWGYTDDLRLYLAVQATTLSSAVALLLLFNSPFAQKRYLFAAFGSYAIAILCEQLDHQIFGASGGLISGHTIKHLLAGLAPFWVFLMLRARSAAPSVAS